MNLTPFQAPGWEFPELLTTFLVVPKISITPRGDNKVLKRFNVGIFKFILDEFDWNLGLSEEGFSSIYSRPRWI